MKKVFWYINNEFYKKTDKTEKIFFTPTAGEVKISCTDDRGQNADVFITVTFID